MPTIPMQSTEAQEAAIAYLVAQLPSPGLAADGTPLPAVTVADYRQSRLVESLERCVAQARDHVTAAALAGVTSQSPLVQAAIIKQVSGATVDPALLSQTEAD